MTEQRQTPVLARAALRPFVQAAQSQPIVATRLSAHEVQRAWTQAQHERKHGRRALGLGVALGVAAAALVAVVTTSLLSHEVRDRSEVAIASDEFVVIPEIVTAVPPALSMAIRIRSDHGAEPPRVLGPWSIALDAGKHELVVQPGKDHALRIELPERTLELVHGEMSIELVEHSAVVRLESGVAAWIAADGTRTQIEVERIELASGATTSLAVPATTEPSASTLAREAESMLMAGQRDEAISLLRKLVRKFPRTPQARTALMDLAAQERLAGDVDRARCAYLLYLDRWPHSEVRFEIDKQLRKLGDGPACRGLDPR